MSAPLSRPPRRKTVTELTDPELDELYAALEHAQAAVSAAAAVCGSGRCAQGGAVTGLPREDNR